MSDAVGQDFGLSRFNVDGSLDATFGRGGKVTSDFGSTSESATTIGVQSDGKIVVAGIAVDLETADFVLARYTVDGRLDETSGINGSVRTDLGGTTAH